MQITAIEPRRKSLAEVYIDGQSAGKVDLETLLRQNLRVGDDITDAQWGALCAESDVTRAKSYALWLLGSRSYSTAQLEEKLRGQYGAEAAEAASARMQELGLLNDAEYAYRCASDLFRLKHFSVSRVIQELRQRGIPADIAEQAAEEAADLFAPDATEAVAELLRTKFAGKYQDEKGRRRTVAALYRMGYRWDDIRAAMALDEE
ncbi:MAG: RecX family transcriptional regulator [Clostridia bacterium]|nr:RecX family transcriptional regulator [Clostridia bacterium]